MNNPVPKAEPDFLQRLVSRELEEESAIEPRLPSLFEPASQSSLDAGVSWQDASARVADEAMENHAGDGTVEAGRPQARIGPTPMRGHELPNAATASRGSEPMQLDLQPATAHELDIEPPVQPMLLAKQLDSPPATVLGLDIEPPVQPMLLAKQLDSPPATVLGVDTEPPVQPMLLAKQPDPQPAAAHGLDAEPPARPTPSPRQRVAAPMRRFPAAPIERGASAEHPPPKAVDVVTDELHPFAGEMQPREGRRPMTGTDDLEASSSRTASQAASGMEQRTKLPARTDLDDTRGTLVPVSIAAAQRIAVALPMIPYRPTQREAPIEQAGASAAPMVNITIGRLEVRALPATGPAAKPRNERRGAQPMTLDDYFKQRRGER